MVAVLPVFSDIEAAHWAQVIWNSLNISPNVHLLLVRNGVVVRLDWVFFWVFWLDWLWVDWLWVDWLWVDWLWIIWLASFCV